MPLDTNLALQFRLPQAEQPFQTLGGMLTLRGELMKQDEAQRQIRDRMAFENEVRALPESERTTENVTKIAAKYASAKDLYHYGQASIDRQAQIKATQEAATTRLQQTATQSDRMYQLKIDAAKDDREKTFWQQQRDQKRLEFEAERVRQGAGKLFFDTNIDYRGNVPNAAVAMPQGAPQPNASPVGGVDIQSTLPSGNSLNMRGATQQQIKGLMNDPNTPPDLKAALSGYMAQSAGPTPTPITPVPGQGVPGVRAAQEAQPTPRTQQELLKQRDANKPPPGYRVTPQGNLEAIPGGPADTKLQGVLNQDTQALNNTSSAMDRLAAEARAIKDHAGLSKATGKMGWVPGIGGLATIPGTDAANFKARLDTLKSQVAFGVLQEMRNNSKTGGALGQVSDKEGILLQNNLAALDRAQSPEEFRAALERIVKYTEDAKDRLRTAYNLKHGEKNPSSGGVRFLGFEP